MIFLSNFLIFEIIFQLKIADKILNYIQDFSQLITF